ncbi:helix-turn-helix domain-containing protein [Nocardia sp. NPDC051981]|uniref:helix-turn-helix domain-containing protein n=1 Tax=Nocardia sp. NPDC051981 TaxID=3155417 RepID=UPI00342BFD20
MRRAARSTERRFHRGTHDSVPCRGGAITAAAGSPTEPIDTAHRHHLPVIAHTHGCAGLSFRAIAEQLRRSPSTVSREVARNGGRDAYRAVNAQTRAVEQRCRPKQLLLERNSRLRQRVVELLEQQWSPEQIAGRLRLDHPDDPGMRISHETIYRCVYTIHAR